MNNPHSALRCPTAGSGPGAYIGRFAPSPTGPLHLGSLLAAVASYLDAKAASGQWLLRIDDLDHLRCRSEHTDAITFSLRAHGLHWDAPPLVQSERRHLYDAALQHLDQAGLLYPCDCSRRILRGLPIYPGTCRHRIARSVPEPHALRIRFGDPLSEFDDRHLGYQRCQPDRDLGDFIARRRDGIASYQLGTVVDDAASGVNNVVRGSDLLEDTHRQRFLQQCLGLQTPRYCHLPVLLGDDGVKLSKQTGAPAIDDKQPSANLRRCLALLAQPEPPDDMLSPDALLVWGAEHWDLGRVPALTV